MMKYLQDFLVILETGEVIFSKITNIKVEEQIFGAMISALRTFYSQTLEGQICTIKGTQYIINIFSKEHIQFIGITPRHIGRKQSLQELKSLAHKFLKKYSKSVKKNGLINVHIYEDFNYDLLY
ncbi:MAG: hypothetical protein ACFFBF_06650 [Promethearchaeota archaeon]